MIEEIENQDSNPEGEQDTTPENEPNEELTKSKEYGDNQKIRAEKAEKKVKELEAKPSEPVENETPIKIEPKEQSSEPDYAKLSFLEGRKVDNPDDQQIVLSEAERLKLPLTDVLEMEHIKSKLKDAKDQRESTEGMPKGSGKGTGKTRNDVDYYTSKPQKADGTYETPADLDLADKVIEARMKKEKQGNQFSEELYTG